MKTLKKITFWVAATLLTGYLSVIIFYYHNQEVFLFHPKKLPVEYRFNYSASFQELNTTVEEGIDINGLLFKSDSTKGLVFYLHGNAGQLDTWGKVAGTFTAHNYDCFIMDYRGFGKSGGDISSEEQLHSDVSTVYKQLLKKYSEENTIIAGYSLGTGLAIKLASHNQPRALILKAPYNSMRTLLNIHYPFLPGWLLKYQLPSQEYVKNVKAPITIFHGINDKLIPIKCAQELKNACKNTDRLIQLPNQGHGKIDKNPVYIKTIKQLLTN